MKGKSISKVRDTPQDMSVIIHSLEYYALNDIRYIKSKPIAAFILSICFIEQMSILLYEFEANDSLKPERFFIEYMPEYVGINLYHKARHSLVHNYSSRYQFDIDNVGFENVAHETIKGVIHLNTDVFISYLEKAFKKVLIDLNNPENEHYENVLKNSTYYPVLVDTSRK